MNKNPGDQDSIGLDQVEQTPELRARSEHIQLLLGYGIYVLLGNIAAGCTLVTGAWERHSHLWLSAWLLVVLLYNVLRWLFRHRFPTGTLTEHDLDIWDRRILLSVLLSGTFWGSAGVLFFLPGESGNNFFLAVLLIGLAAAAATSLSYHRWAYPAFFVPAVTPITIELVLEEGLAERALAWVTPFYFFLMYLLSRHIYRTAHASILQRLRHQHLAYFDPLTEVANRRAFEETLNREWLRALRSTRPLSLIITDIDDFKHYNDTYGHATGDEVLYAIAQMIGERIRRGADLAARIGGEEFAVILPDTDLAGARTLAEQIRRQCHQLKPHSDRIYEPPHLSIGVSACIPDASHGVEDLFEQADKALYAAKQQGKDRVVSLTVA